MSQQELLLELDRGAIPAPRFDADPLHAGEWDLIKRLDSERRGPDGRPWPKDASS